MFDAYTLNQAAPYATDSEITYIIELAQKEEPKTVVMLGAGPGVLALALYDHSIRGKTKNLPELTVIDHSTCEYARSHLMFMGVPLSSLHFWTVDSAVAATWWNKSKIDLLIVDADHSTEAVLNDIDAWFDHVSSGGLIFFHDFLERENGFNGTEEWKEGTVALALEHRADLAWEIENEVGISVVFRKL